MTHKSRAQVHAWVTCKFNRGELLLNCVKMADLMQQILQSDSDESDFEGFFVVDNESDIDIPSDLSDDSSSDNSEDDEPRNAEWTRRFSDFRVRSST